MKNFTEQTKQNILRQSPSNKKCFCPLDTIVRNDNKLKSLIFSTILFCLFNFTAKAWGPVGHSVVGNVAVNLLKPAAKAQVLALLDGMSIDTAANWMDIMRSNSQYDFVKPWHYVDYGKDEPYPGANQDQIVNKITAVIKELQHKDVLCSEQIKMDVLILFHLIGDLHQPLHTGYDSDLGGNKVNVQYDTLKANLHSFWDEYVLSLNGIDLKSTMAYYDANGAMLIDSINKINPELWMSETRRLLPSVYNYSGYLLSKDYVTRQKVIVERQLALAGIRLANVLNSLFEAKAEELAFCEVAKKIKNGINAKNAADYIGKEVVACGVVSGIKRTSANLLINMGSKFPKSELTIVIFNKDKKNFPEDIEGFFRGKNICVAGKPEMYRNKVEMKITSAKEVQIL
jgi:hypothetical protein